MFYSLGRHDWRFLFFWMILLWTNTIFSQNLKVEKYFKGHRCATLDFQQTKDCKPNAEKVEKLLASPLNEFQVLFIIQDFLDSCQIGMVGRSVGQISTLYIGRWFGRGGKGRRPLLLCSTTWYSDFPQKFLILTVIIFVCICIWWRRP